MKTFTSEVEFNTPIESVKLVDGKLLIESKEQIVSMDSVTTKPSTRYFVNIAKGFANNILVLEYNMMQNKWYKHLANGTTQLHEFDMTSADIKIQLKLRVWKEIKANEPLKPYRNPLR